MCSQFQHCKRRLKRNHNDAFLFALSICHFIFAIVIRVHPKEDHLVRKRYPHTTRSKDLPFHSIHHSAEWPTLLASSFVMSIHKWRWSAHAALSLIEILALILFWWFGWKSGMLRSKNDFLLLESFLMTIHVLENLGLQLEPHHYFESHLIIILTLVAFISHWAVSKHL